MTTKITRRALLGAAGAGVVTLGSAEAAALAASSEASGSREPHYAMVFDQNKCVGCGDCKPACVESCKYDALVFGNVNDPYSYISRLIRAKDTVRIRPELGTRPSLRYIPFVKKGA